MRRIRKKYERPKRLFDQARIEEEHHLVRVYGLKNKKEIWKFEALVRNFKRRARNLISKKAAGQDIAGEEKLLFKKLAELGVLSEGAKLDDVLDLKVTDFLDRRLQTVVHKKGIAKTPRHARQLIAHGRITIDDRKVDVPSYLVKVEEEKRLKLK